MNQNLSFYVLFITIVVVCISGCASHEKTTSLQLHSVVKKVKSIINKPTTTIVPSLPSLSSVQIQSSWLKYQNQISSSEIHIRYYDWDGAIQPIVNRILQIPGIREGSILLIDRIDNRTNGLLNEREITEILHKMLANSNTFKLVSDKQLSLAKTKLGLSPQDRLGSRSKAIGIARNIGAKYVLYSDATGDVNSPYLQIQLILVQTGEIIWSGKAQSYSFNPLSNR